QARRGRMLERRGGRVYLYRYLRQGGRSRRVYVAANAEAERLAAEQAARDLARSELAEHCRRRGQDLDGACAGLEALGEGLDWLTRAALLAVGYHRHAGGQWRRRRHLGGKEDDGRG